MALEVAFGAVLTVLVDRLASRRVVAFIRGKKVNNVGLIRKLKQMLLSANAGLGDAEEKQTRNKAVRAWLGELKDALNEADSLLNEIGSEALRRRLEEAEFGSSSTSEVQNLIDSSDEFDESLKPKILDILDNLEYIVDEKKVLGLRDELTFGLEESLPTTSLQEDSGVLYGRDEDKEIIVKLLLSDDASTSTSNRVRVIPILGRTGIGKTELARSVNNDIRVKNHFDLQAWIWVSKDFDIVGITQTIYGSITSQRCDIEDLNLLQIKLKEALTGTRFLLVLDDVWDLSYISWDLLRRPFENEACQSKIIITTRDKHIASMMGTLPAHYLMEISDEDCWLLFVKHAFENAGTTAHSNPEVIRRQIVRKCKGSPLVAKTLGGLMRSERNLDKWELILGQDQPEIAHTARIEGGWELNESYANPCL
ncbi:putative disease resistance RPP13-like protein 1 [Rosa rugosa]|uniref:putative disease resistance RPP13-like protein 1 n=1 Tax=Rosa rugosa TaxID=74645 RepID=UPI002B4163B5|nr:putative disease resistance RPP13-like protein 1 [Rosa rugosa]